MTISMKKKVQTLLSLFAIMISFTSFSQVKILIFTGGHDFEQSQFFEMFESFADIDYDTIRQPHGNELLNTNLAGKYACIVYYDMYQDISDKQKNAMLQLLEEGQGMLFLHHALVSYQDWKVFEKIIGGKYHREESKDQKISTYRHDVDFRVNIVGNSRNHPIVQGMNDFEIHDEVYGNFTVEEQVQPLLTTNHPESSPIVGWCHQYKNSRIVYLQPGHDHHAYENEHYRNLVYRAIKWTGKLL